MADIRDAIEEFLPGRVFLRPDTERVYKHLLVRELLPHSHPPGVTLLALSKETGTSVEEVAHDVCLLVEHGLARYTEDGIKAVEGMALMFKIQVIVAKLRAFLLDLWRNDSSPTPYHAYAVPLDVVEGFLMEQGASEDEVHSALDVLQDQCFLMGVNVYDGGGFLPASRCDWIEIPPVTPEKDWRTFTYVFRSKEAEK